MHRNTRRVVDAAAELGLEISPRHFPDGAKTAADAAAAIGVEVGQIVKSLIFAVDGEVVLAYVSGSNQLDEARLAAAAGGTSCARVDADTVRATTGYPIGGVPPFGHTTPLRAFVDPDLLAYGEVWAAAGTWHDVFALSPGGPGPRQRWSGRRPETLSSVVWNRPDPAVRKRQNGSGGRLVERLQQGVPGQGGALDAHGELDHALQRLEVAEGQTAARRWSLVAVAVAVAASSIDIIPLNRRTSPRTSSTECPLIAWLIIEAELCEIEQPCPSTLMSLTTSPSTWRYTVISSPHSGLWPWATTAGGVGNSPRFRGVR